MTKIIKYSFWIQDNGNPIIKKSIIKSDMLKDDSCKVGDTFSLAKVNIEKELRQMTYKVINIVEVWELEKEVMCQLISDELCFKPSLINKF